MAPTSNFFSLPQLARYEPCGLPQVGCWTIGFGNWQTLADTGRHPLKFIRSKFVTCPDQSLKIPQISQSLRSCRDIRHFSRDLQGVFFQTRLAFARMSLCLQMCAQRYGTIPIVTLCGGLKDSPKARLVRLEMLSSSFSKYIKLHGIKTYQDSVATLCRTQ